MSKKNKEQTTTKTENKKERVKPLAVLLFYKADAEAMGFTGEEEGISGLIKAKVRTTFSLPAPQRSSDVNSALRTQLEGMGYKFEKGTPAELNKIMKKAIVEGKFTPKPQ